jgi:hypothetical protein
MELNLPQVINLPKEVIDLIQSYIPFKYLIFTNKYYYDNYHFLLKNEILYKYERYIHFIIVFDYDFIFKHLINENNNIKHWVNLKRYLHKYTIYHNYFYFLISSCIDNEATKCKNLLTTAMNKGNLNKNVNKKVRHIRWTKT